MKRAFATYCAAVSVALGCNGDDASLPHVEPRGPRCEELALDPGKRCLQEGWFLFSRWTTAELYGAHTEEVPPVPRRPVYLDTLLIDEREVTNEEYQRYVERTQSSPPPEQCGYVDSVIVVDVSNTPDPEISGWVGGTFDASRASHPVVCVTRTEAQSFCEERGGRLPTVFEWSRAVRDAYPDARRFPWGDTPPPTSAEPWPDLGSGRWWDPYAIVSRFGPNSTPSTGLWTEPVGTAPAGASAAGVLDLAGNASELLASCGEDLAEIADTTEPLIRPALHGKVRCADGVAVAGSSWRSHLRPEQTLASSIWIMRDGANEIRYPSSTHQYYASDMRLTVWGEPRPNGTLPDSAGNDRRSWRIGFRCVYDAR